MLTERGILYNSVHEHVLFWTANLAFLSVYDVFLSRIGQRVQLQLHYYLLCCRHFFPSLAANYQAYYVCFAFGAPLPAHKTTINQQISSRTN